MNEAVNVGLRQEDGFVVVTLEGDPYQIGLQHGRLLADRIQLMRRTLYDDLIFRQGRLFGLGFVALARSITAILERHIPEPLKLEIRGVADGSGIGYRDVLFFNCFDDLLHALIRLVLTLPPQARARVGLACSALVSLPSPGGDEPMLLGRNLDYYVSGGVLGADGIVTRTMKEQLVCFAVRPDRGARFFSIGWPGFVGTVTGVNQHGVAIACLTSALPGQTPNGTPLPLLYRSILQWSGELDQVERIVRRARRTVGNNLVAVSARERNAALFEFTPREVRRRDPIDGRLATTNHFQDAQLAARQAQWLLPNSTHRYRRLETLCATPEVTVSDGQRFLLDTCPSSDAEAEEFSCLYNPGTVYSTVIAPRERRLWLRATDRVDRPFVSLDLAAELGLESALKPRVLTATSG